MKDLRILTLTGIVFLCSCGGSEDNSTLPGTDDDPVQEPPVEEAPWNLIWEEEFSSDLEEWTPWFGGAFNNELQLYKPENLSVKEGNLYIRQVRESVSGPVSPFDNTPGSFSFSSGRIETKEVFGPGFSAGMNSVRFAARIKLPVGEGLWPAFWSFNDPWPTAGEIDVMEYRGGEPGRYQTNFHYGENNGQLSTDPVKNEGVFEFSGSLADDFHIYEVEWSGTMLTMKFDDEIVKVYDAVDIVHIPSIFGKKHRLVLNLAVGGDFFNGRNLQEAAIPDESFLIVDWVKVYAR